MMTWHFENHGDGYSNVNGDEMAAVNDEFSPENVEGNDETKGMLNSGRVTTVVKGEEKSMLTWLLDNDSGNLTTVNGEDERHADVAYQQQWQTNGENNDSQRRQLFFDEMLTWQNKEEDEEELSKFLDEASKLCGSSFYDSDTSYMAGICGAWSGVADAARGEMEAEWGECEDERCW
nr:hypothetical protein [Tanacetum cinerariifolium]